MHVVSAYCATHALKHSSALESESASISSSRPPRHQPATETKYPVGEDDVLGADDDGAGVGSKVTVGEGVNVDV